MFIKNITLFIGIIVVSIELLICLPSVWAFNDCSEVFSFDEDNYLGVQELDRKYDLEYEKNFEDKRVTRRKERIRKERKKIVQSRAWEGMSSQDELPQFGDIRINNMGIILQQIADIYESMYFDKLEGNTSSSYLFHGKEVSYELIKSVLARVDELMRNFCEFVFFDDENLDDFESLMKNEETKQARIEQHRIKMIPDVSVLMMFSVLKHIWSGIQIWRAYIKDEGKLYMVKPYLPAKTLRNHIGFDDPRFLKYVPFSVQKRLVGSILLYYSLEFKDKAGYSLDRKIRLVDKIVTAKELMDFEYEEKLNAHRTRMSNMKKIYDSLARVSDEILDTQKVLEKVINNQLLLKIQSTDIFKRVVDQAPFLMDQDLIFTVKFFKHSIYAQRFIKEIQETFLEDESVFIEQLTKQADILDLDQMFYVGQYGFSIGNILDLLMRNHKEENLSASKIMQMFLNLFGSGINVDRLRLAVNIETLMHYHNIKGFSKALRKDKQFTGSFSYYDESDLIKTILSIVRKNPLSETSISLDEKDLEYIEFMLQEQEQGYDF